MNLNTSVSSEWRPFLSRFALAFKIFGSLCAASFLLWALLSRLEQRYEAQVAKAFEEIQADLKDLQELAAFLLRRAEDRGKVEADVLSLASEALELYPRISRSLMGASFSPGLQPPFSLSSGILRVSKSHGHPSGGLGTLSMDVRASSLFQSPFLKGPVLGSTFPRKGSLFLPLGSGDFSLFFEKTSPEWGALIREDFEFLSMLGLWIAGVLLAAVVLRFVLKRKERQIQGRALLYEAELSQKKAQAQSLELQLSAYGQSLKRQGSLARSLLRRAGKGNLDPLQEPESLLLYGPLKLELFSCDELIFPVFKDISHLMMRYRVSGEILENAQDTLLMGDLEILQRLLSSLLETRLHQMPEGGFLSWTVSQAKGCVRIHLQDEQILSPPFLNCDSLLNLSRNTLEELSLRCFVSFWEPEEGGIFMDIPLNHPESRLESNVLPFSKRTPDE